ncbi:DUF5658 family protein [Chloroflexota bacterium]
MKHLLGILMGLEVLDGLLTHYLVRNGIAQEANPFLESIVQGDNFLSFKICGGILAIFLLWSIYARWPKASAICASCFVVFYSVIVMWNSSLLFIA